jgi:hypothetical protein
MKKSKEPEYLLQCGSCKYKKDGKCKNFNSDCAGGIVVDDCSCEFWQPRIGFKHLVADMKVAYIIALITLIYLYTRNYEE